MTTDKGFKRLVRARAARTGESYAAARRSLVGKSASPATHDLWFTRASHGYGGRRAAKPAGYEHHRVTVDPAGITVEADVAFSSYGTQHYRVAAQPGAATFTHHTRGVAVDGRVADDAPLWTGAVTGRDGDAGRFELALPPGTSVVLPSTVARFLPLLAADGTTFVVVPEDGFPAWRPPGRGSWFPVMGARGAVERRMLSAAAGDSSSSTRVDHVLADDPATVRATTWIDTATGEVTRYEQPGLVLVRVSEEEAMKRAPTDLT